jgi:hypothetical protein
MNTKSWIAIVEGLNIALALGLLIRWGWPTTPPSTELYTLFEAQDGIEDLHAPNAVAHRVTTVFQQDGGVVTVEDIVRHLHANPKLMSTPTHVELFEQMLHTQTLLLNTEEELQQVELKMNRLSLEIYNSLSESDKVRIRSRRNTDSVEGIEAQYWKALLEQVQHTKDQSTP